jgi:acetyl esterase
MPDIHPQFAPLVEAIHAGPRWETLEPAALRQMPMAPPAQAPIDSVATRDLEVGGAAGPLPARLYTPGGSPDAGPGLVFFHGGGFVIGDLASHDTVCRRLAERSGVRILSVAYRLAPEHRFPAAHDDALASTRWAFDNAASLGFDRERIGIGGDSAGGNLSASVALDLRRDPIRRLRFQLLLYPATQTAEKLPSRIEFAEGYFLTGALIDYFIDHLFGEEARQDDPRVAVLNQDVTGAPPAFVSVGSCDPLRDESRAYADKLKAAGTPAEYIEYPGFIHGFYSFADVAPAALAAFDDAATALKKGLAQPPAGVAPAERPDLATA